MREDFEVQINIRPGIYQDEKGNEYLLIEVAKNISNYSDYVILKSLESGKTFICPADFFVSLSLDAETEELKTRFRIKRLFE